MPRCFLRHCTAAVVFAGVILCVCAPFASAAETTTTKYFDQLRRRRLFRLAEGVCVRQLRRDDLTLERRSRLTLELSRTYAEHAKYSVGDEQQTLWTEARNVISETVRKQPGLSVLETYRLRLQRAIAGVLESEFLLWDARIFPEDAARRNGARKKLAAAVAELQRLGGEISRTYHSARLRKPNRPVDHVLVRQLKNLLRHQEYQLAIATLNHAAIHPKGSTTQKRLAAKAEKLLEELAGVSLADAIVWNSRVMLVTAARLRGADQKVVERIHAVERKRPPVEIVDRTIAERIKMFLRMEPPAPAEADRLLKLHRNRRGGLPGELAFLRVRIDLALWAFAKKSGKPAAARMFLKQATADAREAEETLGGYWGYRCRLLTSNSRDDKKFGHDLAKSIRAAEAAHRNRRWDDAVAGYRRAIAVAEKSNKPDVAGRLLFALGALQLGRNRFSEAAAAFGRISETAPDFDRAGDAHLMWAYCLGRVYDTERTKANRLAYTNALQKHRESFSDSPTAGEAAWMLAMLQERRLQLTRALELYLSVPAGHRRGTAAQAAAARCLEGIHDRLRELKRTGDLKAWEEYAIEKLTGVVEAFPKTPQPLSLDQAEVLMRLARIHLNRAQPDYAVADGHLKRLFDARSRAKTRPKLAGEEKKAWTRLAQIGRQLRIVSLAGSGRADEAGAAMAQLADADASEVLAILDGLMQLAAGSDRKTRRALGALQLQAAVALDRKRKSLSPNEQAWLDLCLAQASAASGRIYEAIAYYERLLKQSPRNKRLLRTTAELLMQSRRADDVAKAEKHWRRLESLENKGSREWLAARLQIARCLHERRRFDECRKLLTVTKLLYPKLGDDELRKQYESLLKVIARR